MADIELVIKISEETYNNLKIGCTQRISNSEMIEALKNGTPLPKAENHGFIAVCDSMDVITQEVANKLKNTVFIGDEDCSYCFDIMEIIDAERSE